MSHKQKVLVSGYDLKFWKPLQDELEKTGLFEFKQDVLIGNYGHNDQKALELIEWADILIAEWTMNNAVFLSKHKKPHQKLITRFHAQERFTDYPNQIDYSNVDSIVFVGAHIMREAINKFPIPKEICSVVGNFIDMEKYNLAKFGDAEFYVGMIGIVPLIKRLDLAFEILEELVKIHPSYRLYIKGHSPMHYPWLWKREHEKKYYEELFTRINASELRNHIVFDPAGDDVHYWLQKIGYILSPSDSESFHVAVSEGVSSSAFPIVWNWEGASDIYPPFPLMNDAKNAAKFIERMRVSNSRAGLLEHCKNTIGQRYAKSVIAQSWIELLNAAPKNKTQVQTRPSLQHFKKVIVVYSITNFNIFHRKEMLEALSHKIDADSYLLIIEPGSHYKTLLDKGLEDENTLNQFANTEILPINQNMGRIKALHGNLPSDIAVDEKLRKITTHQESIFYFIKKNFNQNIEIIHWLYKPEQIKYVAQNQRYFYEVYDEYTMDFATGKVKEDVLALEKQVLQQASGVFFTSEPLSERKKAYTQKSTVISNGVVFDLFNKYHNIKTQAANKRKSVGYLGNLSDFFNWSLMQSVCQAMPEVDFFFHGQLEFKKDKDKQVYSEISQLDNVYFSGRVTRDQGAAAISCYDALIIPFVINEAMHAVNPLKLWEYFATGKPVISSPMDAINIPSPLLYVAKDKDDWLNSLNAALQEDANSAIAAQRIQMAKDLSWDVLAGKYNEKMQEVFEK